MDFIIGADVSSLQAMEDKNAKFYDLDGKPDDALAILARHGVNYIRLRLFNRPTESFDGGDYCDLQHTLALAKRVKALGLGLLLDFHYSDFWADWKKQQIPSDWIGQSPVELEQSIYDFTKHVLTQFSKNQAMPDIVQIGNEIGKGLLWDYGRLEETGQLVRFLNSGLAAAEELQQDGMQIKTMLHLECGGDAKRTEAFFSDLFTEGLRDFDYIGLSYYPYWAGSYELLKENLRNIEVHFGKPVIIVETAFPYTDQSHDEMPNIVTGELTRETMNLSPSVANQRQVIERVIATVRESRNGRGVFYWEPGWYQVDGVGVAKGKGNEWENQAVFDADGHALESIRAFDR